MSYIYFDISNLSLALCLLAQPTGSFRSYKSALKNKKTNTGKTIPLKREKELEARQKKTCNYTTISCFISHLH